MDSEDARNIYKQLSILDRNDDHTFKLVKQQISVMSSNFDKLSKPIKLMEKDFTAMSKNLRELGESFENLTNSVNGGFTSMNLKMQLFEYISLVNAQLLEIQNRQSSEMAILNDLYQNQLHPFLLDADNITSSVRRGALASRIPTSMRDFHILHLAAKLSVFPMDDHLVIKIVIPLPESTIFTLQKVYRLPLPLNAEWDLSLQTKHDYIAETRDKTTFITLSQAEREKCQTVPGDFPSSLTICQHTKPVLTSGNSECLVDLLQHSDSWKENCKYKAVPSTQGVLIKMLTTNNWLYSFNITFIVNVNCNGAHSSITLENSGILRLKEPCEFRNKQFIIPFENSVQEEYTYKRPEIDHSDIRDVLRLTLHKLGPNDVNISVKSTHKLPLNMGHHDEIWATLDEGKRSIDDLQKEWDREREYRKTVDQSSEIEVHRYSIISTASVLIIIAFSMGVVMVIKRKNNKADTNISLQLNTISATPRTDEVSNVPHPPAPRPTFTTNAARRSMKKPKDLTFACV